MFPVPESVGHLLDRLDLGIQALGHGVRDPVGEVGQDVWEMALNRLGRFDDGNQAGMGRPEVPSDET